VTPKPRKKRLPYHHAAAFREAGHAVAAWRRGVMLMPISIFASGKGAGRNVWNDPLRNVDFDWVRSADSSALVERLASVLLAGPISEGLFGPRLRRGGASTERIRDARALLRAISDPRNSRNERYTTVHVEVERFLADPSVKEAVDAVASALLDRGTIPGGEAASIIESHLEKPRRTG
jgi:hypothetical protein